MFPGRGRLYKSSQYTREFKFAPLLTFLLSPSFLQLCCSTGYATVMQAEPDGTHGGYSSYTTFQAPHYPWRVLLSVMPLSPSAWTRTREASIISWHAWLSLGTPHYHFWPSSFNQSLPDRPIHEGSLPSLSIVSFNFSNLPRFDNHLYSKLIWSEVTGAGSGMVSWVLHTTARSWGQSPNVFPQKLGSMCDS